MFSMLVEKKEPAPQRPLAIPISLINHCVTVNFISEIKVKRYLKKATEKEALLSIMHYDF